MIPLPSFSSPTYNVRKTPLASPRNRTPRKSPSNMSTDSTVATTCSCDSASSSLSLKKSVSFHDEACNTFHDTLQMYDYTRHEVAACFYYVDELEDMKTEAQALAKSNKHERGLERFTHASKKRAMVEMAREAVLYDCCLQNYSMNSKIAAREAVERAQIDAECVDREELATIMKELAPTIPTKTPASPNPFRAKLGHLLQRRNRPTMARGA